jgi:hypothetical protein
VDVFSLAIETIAAPISTVLRLPWSWEPAFPLVVLTGPRHGFLSDCDRDLLWSRYEVPVYEHLLDAQGFVLARECDAHRGLHVLPGVSCSADGRVQIEGQTTGITAEMVQDFCGCGEHSARLISVSLDSHGRASAAL